MEFSHGSDIGPKCWRCSGTIWRYGRARHSGYWVAECAGCKVAEGAFVAADDSNATELRIAHESFLAAISPDL